MNVAFFIPSIMLKGGVERALISLINSLCRNDSINVHLIVFNYQKGDEAFDLNDKVIIHSLDITNYKRQIFLIYYRLFKLLNKYKFQNFVTVETMSLIFTFLPLKFTSGLSTKIVWEHFNFYNNNNLKWRHKLRYFAAKNVDYIITLTERDKITWQQELKCSATIKFIYNISPYQEQERVYTNFSNTAIAVGRYVNVKGFGRLIEAWGLLEKRYDIGDWKLQIIGFGPMYDELQQNIIDNECKSIELINGGNEMKKFYSEAAFLCMSSYFEGLPMTMIEAQCFGLPIIAFDIYTGPKEIIEKDSGIIITDNDLNAYVDGLYSLIHNESLRNEMANAASKLSKRFNETVIVEEWIKLFENKL